jgi:hypothetical protein
MDVMTCLGIMMDLNIFKFVPIHTNTFQFHTNYGNACDWDVT